MKANPRAPQGVASREPVLVVIPPSMDGDDVFRVIGRQGEMVTERWDATARKWTSCTRTAGGVANMMPAGSELLARLRIPDA